MNFLPETPLHEVTFCALDLETTGPNPLFHRIVEIGIIIFTLSEVKETYQTLINPEASIPDDVIKIHGITNRMVTNAPLIGDVVDELDNLIKKTILVIQNPIFDLSFLDIMYREQKKRKQFEAIDTVRLAKMAFPDLASHKLGMLCRSLKIDIDPHRAFQDAMGCMEVFKKVVAKEDPGHSWRLMELFAYHGALIKPGLKRKKISRKRIFKGIQVGEKVTIDYVDSEGSLTTREILPHEFVKYGKKSYLFAFCHLRGEERYFNPERILKVY